MNNLADRIRTRRLELGLTQAELAKRMGYTSRSSINKIESGINDLSHAKLCHMAEALETTPAALMGMDEPAPEPIGFPYKPMSRIPILGRIAAGVPLYAEEQIDGYMQTELNHGGEYFGLRVSGDSMNALNINDGNILVVRRQPVVEQNDIAVVLVDGNNATVKQFQQKGDHVMLVPRSTNPIHTVQIYDLHETRIDILGKVVQNIINFE